MWVDAQPVLSGVTVLDLSLQLPGPYTTRLLADLGAQVHRVEPPGGDPARAFHSLYTEVNAGKLTELADLKAPAGLRRVLDLARESDVLVEGFRPGVLDHLGVGYETVADLNPRLIYCSISGYGQDGQRATKPGHDLTYQADAGTLSQGGTAEDKIPPLPFADLASGLMAALTIVAALNGRTPEGGGVHLDVSMADVMASWTFPTALARRDGEVDLFSRTPHYGVFDTADGQQVALGIVHEQHFWQRFCNEFGLAEHESSFLERQADHDRLRGLIEDIFGSLGAEEIIARTSRADVPAAAVQAPEVVLDSELFQGRGVVRPATSSARYAHPVRFQTRPPASIPLPASDLSDPGFHP